MEATADTSADKGRHVAPSALTKWLYAFALFLPMALLLQRQNWVPPHTGLGQGLGQVTALIIAGGTVALFASGMLPPIPWDGPVPRLLLLWLVLVYASYFFWAFDGLKVASLYADLGLIQFTLEAVFVLGIMSALHPEAHLWRFVKVLVVCGGLYGGLLIVTAGASGEIAESLRIPLLEDTGSLSGVEAMRAGLTRPQGMAGHPLEAGCVSAALIPIGVALCQGLAAKGRRYGLWAVLTGLTALGALSTLSRSATVALLLAFAVMAMRWPFRLVARAFAGLLACAILIVVAFPNRAAAYLGLFGMSTKTDSSLLSRQLAREHVGQVIATHFWTGEGIGSQGALGRPTLDNQYLGFALELGVPVALGAVLLIGVPILFCLHRAGSLPTRRGYLALGLAGALTVFGSVFAVLDAFAFPQIRVLFWVLLGLVGPTCTLLQAPPEAMPAPDPLPQGRIRKMLAVRLRRNP